ncbi:MAG TPA: ABC transporter permease [Candidatus Saccharimonadia bacterium]|nr:ABC transporter permease [Candidatus Saccharimonadia bacterium]
MSPIRTFATAGRVLRQLRHDPRTIVLILFVPSILMIILRYVFNDDTNTFSAMAPMVLGLFPFAVMFLVTSIATLRERTAGTLDRLMTMPMAKLDLLLGYAFAFSVLAVLQGLLASAVTLGWLGVTVQGGAARLLCVASLSGLTGMCLGLFSSAFARSEFQAIQFLPVFVFPQLLMCGLFVPRDQMAKVLQWFSDIMPLTYIVDAMKQVSTSPGWSHALIQDLIVVAAFTIGALILGAATLRRSR